MEPLTGARILVVDDEEKVRDLHARLVEAMGAEAETAADGIEALAKLPLGVDLLLLDGDMPHMDGFEVAQRVREQPQYRSLPIVMVTGLDVHTMYPRALEAAINDVIAKPVDAHQLRLRITWLVELKRSHDQLERRNVELERSVDSSATSLRDALERMTAAERSVYGAHLDTIHRLAVASEVKDADTAGHIERVGQYAGVLAAAAGHGPGEVDRIRYAASMHDVGKIGVPDRILLKPSQLDEDEWGIMRKHTTFGARLLEGSDSTILQMGERIARSHHERWDGSGYPDGLAGEEIPVEARICSIVDFFDAVTMARPYRAALPLDFATEQIRSDDSGHFDPTLRGVFVDCLPEIFQVRDGLHEAGDFPPNSRLRASLDELS